MRIVTDRHFTGFRVQRLEDRELGAWVNLRLLDGDGEAGSLIELNSADECDELIKAATEARRLLTENAGEVSS